MVLLVKNSAQWKRNNHTALFSELCELLAFCVNFFKKKPVSHDATFYHRLFTKTLHKISYIQKSLKRSTAFRLAFMFQEIPLHNFALIRTDLDVYCYLNEHFTQIIATKNRTSQVHSSDVIATLYWIVSQPPGSWGRVNVLGEVVLENIYSPCYIFYFDCELIW